MRTTLTLDDDVADRLKRLAERKRLSFKEVVNTVLRRGLATQSRKQPAGQPFHVESFSSPFRPGIDTMRLNQLNDELQAGGS